MSHEPGREKVIIYPCMMRQLRALAAAGDREAIDALESVVEALPIPKAPVVRVKMGRRVVNNATLTHGLIEAEVRRLEALRGRPLVRTWRFRFR